MLLRAQKGKERKGKCKKAQKGILVKHKCKYRKKKKKKKMKADSGSIGGTGRTSELVNL